MLFSWGSLSAEVVLTDEEYETIMTALTEAETDLIRQEQQLERLLEESETLERIIAALKMEYELQKTFSERQRKDRILENLKWAFGGFVTGNVTGAAWGMKL